MSKGLGQFEEYSKRNLIGMWLFATTEQLNIKQRLNDAGFSKYSSVGFITLNHRKELKKLASSIREDLYEDFDFDVTHFIQDPVKWIEYDILNTLVNGKEYKWLDDECCFDITWDELFQLFRVCLISINPNMISVDDFSKKVPSEFISSVFVNKVENIDKYFEYGYNLTFKYDNFNVDINHLNDARKACDLAEAEIKSKNITDPVLINALHAEKILEVKGIRSGNN